MLTNDLNIFLQGAIAMSAAAIGLHFFRFWRRTRDALFLMFGIAFWLMSATFVAHAFLPPERDRMILYVLRLTSYGAILLGIFLKNRRPARGR